jgi:hypothetical protein
MTAVRALLAPIYWFTVIVLEFVSVPWLLLGLLGLPWWSAVPAAVAAGAAVGCGAAVLQGRVLDWCARRIAVRVENLAVEWREITAAPTLPPSGGTPTDGPAGSPSERLNP